MAGPWRANVAGLRSDESLMWPVLVHTARCLAPVSELVSRIALFADVQNLYYTVRQGYACHFNYAALWAELAAQGEIVEAYAYAIDRGDARQQQFQQILRKLGFEVKLKPYIQRSDGSAKGDWDVGITIDVLDAAPRVDRVVLASGDGDFDLLLQRIRQVNAVQTTVYGVPGLTAQSLIRATDRFCPIEAGLLLRS
ncbi:Uncharacterized conserved protein, LabA/DUF88 family [Pseudomonas pohangensis]|uniref:Uncharacterized conserved protein, LabA/DUF88 family n=2 Tax=Pseudomonas pohangensis TaxID=364197 RepID=A0A1H2H560_9PSED|nr:Uncharacterized conserved protein, LabA/DUF88 family [Pseudomonas pohangensis]